MSVVAIRYIVFSVWLVDKNEEVQFSIEQGNRTMQGDDMGQRQGIRGCTEELHSYSQGAESCEVGVWGAGNVVDTSEGRYAEYSNQSEQR